MLLAMAAGFLVGVRFPGMDLVAMAALGALMTFSLAEVPLRGFGANLRYVPFAFGLSFGLLPALLLLAGIFTSPLLWEGWAILIAVPPAVSIIPFTAILRGNVPASVAFNAVIYVAALAVTPLLALLLLGVAVSPVQLVLTVLVLILLPLILSRLARGSALSPRHLRLLRNLSFAPLTFFIGAANRQVLLESPGLALEALIASVLIVASAAGIVWVLFQRLGTDLRISLVLFSGYKNAGLAATIALALLAPTAVVAPTLMIVFQIFWIPLLARLRSRPGRP
jgi:BASS family bile acid:Na+ symporter